MDYAKNILHKYGWKEGRGLGKDEKGISKPLRCGLKFDKAGIGYNEKVSEETNNQWWIHMFNKAAANIPTDYETKKGSKSSRGSELVGKNVLTDEELFQACGGRTAHKAARHGFRLSGKLKRAHQQEQSIEELTASNEHDDVPEKKSKLSSIEDIDENQRDEGTRLDRTDKKKKKKRKKLRHIAESDANTIVTDSLSPVTLAANGDFARIVEEGSECAMDGDDLSNHCTKKKKKKKKAKNMKEFVLCPVVTSSTFPTEIGQDSNLLRSRKKKRKKGSGIEEISESEPAIDCRSGKFKQKKLPS